MSTECPCGIAREDCLNDDQSPTIGALAKALAAAQGAMDGAKKDRENPAFRSKYADLASVWDACREALSKNDLAVVQTTEPQGLEGVCVVTTLMHASGEWMRGRMFMPATKKDAHGFGSATTYARRFALAAIVGIAPEDDDANAATTAKPAHGPIKAAPTPAPELAEKLEESVDLMGRAKALSGAISSAKTRGTLNEVWLGALELKRAGLPEKAYVRLEALRAEAIDRLSTSAAE